MLAFSKTENPLLERVLRNRDANKMLTEKKDPTPLQMARYNIPYICFVVNLKLTSCGREEELVDSGYQCIAKLYVPVRRLFSVSAHEVASYEFIKHNRR